MDKPKTKMKAVVLEKFGGPEELVLQTIDVPDLGPNDVLIRVEYAGVGVWDIFEREGGYAEMLGIEPQFPYVLGSEGAGHIVAMGEKVSGFHIGDKVYAPGFLNPKGGFYAEYVAIDRKFLTCIPDRISSQQASAISGVGITALRGLEYALQLKPGESVLIFGASGGVGHLAVQLARTMGAKVFAIASGKDGVAMVKKLGVDAVVDGHEDDFLSAAKIFAPEGFDAAFLTAGGEMAQKAIKCVRAGGRIAYPMGVYPEPQIGPEISAIGYYGDPDPEIIAKLNEYIIFSNLTLHVDQTFLLEDTENAHLGLINHYLGKLCLKIT